MVLAHNLTAMNAQRQFNIVGTSKKKSTEKLSSGYKINRAADDAAGLTISEKMRSLIRGLNQGSDNIQDGISLIQIADGAMDEIADMLHRANELSIKAYNDTNTKADREAIQAEVSQLITEINRVAESTEYNTLPLLQGDRIIDVKLTPDTVLTQEIQVNVSTDLPEWLTVDDTVSVHGAYPGTQVSDSTTVLFDAEFENGKIKQYNYYGPVSGYDLTALENKYGEGHIHQGNGGKLYYDEYEIVNKGDFTTQISDNPTAKVSFEGLINNTNSALDLYKNYTALVGTNVAVPCGTCNTRYFGINFNGRFADGDDIKVSSKVGNSSIDLMELDIVWNGKTIKADKAIKDLMKDYIPMVDGPVEPSTPTDKEKKDAKELADVIAKKLADEFYKITYNNTENLNHYDRVNKLDDYSLIVYDYRDEKSLQPEGVANIAVSKKASYQIWTTNVTVEEGITIQTPTPTQIVCSNVKGDYIDIHLPAVNAYALGVNDYDICRYVEKERFIPVSEEEKQAAADALAEYVDTDEYKQYVLDKSKYDDDLAKWNEDNRKYQNSSVKIGEREDVEYTAPDPRYTTYIKNGEFVTKANPLVAKKVTKDVMGRDESLKPGDKPAKTDLMYDVEAKYNDLLSKANKGGYFEKYEEYEPDDNKILLDGLSILLAQRSELGATQNKLEHAYRNNRNKEENTTAAESRIRDTDMATEMVNNTKLNVLEQAVTSMMAQANQSTQGVLSLLQ